MNRRELIAEIFDRSENHAVTRQIIDEVLRGFVEVVADTVAQGDRVLLLGFGTIKAVDRKARQGRRPGTDQLVDIPARRVPRFCASKELKDRVSNG